MTIVISVVITSCKSKDEVLEYLDDRDLVSLTWLSLTTKQHSPIANVIPARDRNIMGPFMRRDFAKAGKCMSGDRLVQSMSSDA